MHVDLDHSLLHLDPFFSLKLLKKRFFILVTEPKYVTNYLQKCYIIFAIRCWDYISKIIMNKLKIVVKICHYCLKMLFFGKKNVPFFARIPELFVEYLKNYKRYPKNFNCIIKFRHFPIRNIMIWSWH